MKDWKAHQWIGATLMAIGVVHMVMGVLLLVGFWR